MLIKRSLFEVVRISDFLSNFLFNLIFLKNNLSLKDIELSSKVYNPLLYLSFETSIFSLDVSIFIISSTYSPLLIVKNKNFLSIEIFSSVGLSISQIKYL